MKQLAALLLLLSLQGCGFTLCQDCGQVRAELQPLHYSSDDPHSPLARRLADLLRAGGATLVSRGDAAATLRLGEETVSRSLLTADSSGNPLEYQVILNARYKLRMAGAEQPERSERLSARRVYRFTSSDVLAGEREIDLLLEDMRTELAHAILRRINLQPSGHPADAPKLQTP